MGKRILVVDDHSDTVDALVDLLEMEGHEVRSAVTAEHALALAETFEPHVVMLDIGLPNMDGYELAAHLRFKVEPDCLFIAATGRSAPSDVLRSKKAGFAAHLTKPIDIPELLALLASTPDDLVLDR
ncbi:MAG: response regulator [Rubrivivax sp.]|nr:MAG: response regulator [Rubrivivax sp.]